MIKSFINILFVLWLIIPHNLFSQDNLPDLSDLFVQASAEFAVPLPLLQGIAFEETRWQHLTWDDGDTFNPCNGLPRVYGVMGLWDNYYFGHSLDLAARLINATKEELKKDPLKNIRGAAAYLKYLYTNNSKFPDNSSSGIESWYNALALFSGYPQQEIAFQRSYDIYRTISEGYNAYHIRIAPVKIDFTLMKKKLDSLKLIAEKNTPLATPDYPGAVWNPASTSNYSTTVTTKYFVVVHDIEGTYLSCISWFKNPSAQVSAHYVVNGKKDNSSDSAAGQITQMVEERYKAWHVGCWNSYMYGIENEGYASNPAWFTSELYTSLGNLIKYLCEKYSIAKDRNRIIAHGEWQNTNWRTWLTANFPAIDGSCNTHTDPGNFWKWDSLMAIITLSNRGIYSGFEYVVSPYWDPNSSGSTYGVSQLSAFAQSSARKKGGTYSGKLTMTDSSANSSWFVRVYYNYSSHDTLKLGTTGYIRAYLNADNVPAGLKFRLAIDDNSSSITEASTWQTVIADGQWHCYEWKLDNPSHWVSFAGGNAQINGPNTYFDSFQFSCNDPNSGSTEYTVYIDNLEKGSTPVNVINLNLNVLLGGLFNSSTNKMVKDTAKVYLRNTTSPYAIADSAVCVFDSLGNASARFDNAPTGNYYIVIKNRNHIETWSKSGGFSLAKESTSSYSFSSSASQAYGNNLFLKGGKYCIYGGDVNQDGQIDLADLVLIDYDNQNFSTGYRVTDVNGDGLITLDDLIIADTNNQNFISVQRP